MVKNQASGARIDAAGKSMFVFADLVDTAEVRWLVLTIVPDFLYRPPWA